MSGAYYNEIDPYAAQWLRNLIAAGHIAPGDVDERSIADVSPVDLIGYTQCHFFAGIGVWSYALRQAGWSDEREVWSGSCPCQPFSDAGAGAAFDDARDLWPAFFALIRERRPVVVVGEQVASRLGLAWLDAVHADLEGEAYTVGAVDTCSAGVGSPNIRQRLYWMAHRNKRRCGLDSSAGLLDGKRSAQRHDADGRSDPDRLGEPGGAGLEGLGWHGDNGHEPGRLGAHAAGSVAEAGEPRGMGDAEIRGSGTQHRQSSDGTQLRESLGGSSVPFDRPGPVNGFWRSADWLCCTDGKWRAVEPGTFPLVTGAASRLGRLRAYGNAINAEAAAAFVRAYQEATP